MRHYFAATTTERYKTFTEPLQFKAVVSLSSRKKGLNEMHFFPYEAAVSEDDDTLRPTSTKKMQSEGNKKKSADRREELLHWVKVMVL